ncbi:uncharacterized protein CPUR_05685 [Claviceps purpurea 20.1]|uniref:F-box domain-containing protein n=1 Tax=Claviceps purpurea (strain 20.1) TaxID=1111077 RepID=M1W8E6_CLAP2|nr:uncharacterized protein CPUR_05685 [Claviceps purpurea 20.1]
MDSAARQALSMARERNTDESRCLIALLPPETKIQIMSYISTQQSLSRLAQSCQAWTLEICRRWGGQINAIQQGLTGWESSDTDLPVYGDLYVASTALHFAVFMGNVRLTKTLLDMEASLTIACSPLLWRSMGSEDVLRRVRYFHHVFEDLHFGSAFSIFLAFIQSHPDMCKLLVDHGAGREAMIVNFHGEPKVMSILHFAAADPTRDYRHWQCLFGGFREYIDEPCPRESQSTPLHIALVNGCTQGMQIAVESGADKEARDRASRTPLYIGVLGILPDTRWDPRTLQERTVCFRKFVELGASVDPEGDSLLLHTVRLDVPHPLHRRLIRHLIYFLLEHHADIQGTNRSQNTNVVNEIVQGIICRNFQDRRADGLLKDLLNDLVDRGLNLEIPAPGLSSPLYCV